MADSDDYEFEELEEETTTAPSAPKAQTKPSATNKTAASTAPVAAANVDDDYEDEFSVGNVDDYGGDEFEQETTTTTKPATTSDKTNLNTSTPKPVATPAKTSSTPAKPTPAVAPTAPASNDDYDEDFETDAPTTVKSATKPAAAAATPSKPPAATTADRPPSAARTLEPSYSSEAFETPAPTSSLKQKPASIDDAPVDYKESTTKTKDGTTTPTTTSAVTTTKPAAATTTPAATPVKPAATSTNTAKSTPTPTSTVKPSATPTTASANSVPAATSAKPAAAVTTKSTPAASSSSAPSVTPASPTASAPSSSDSKLSNPTSPTPQKKMPIASPFPLPAPIVPNDAHKTTTPPASQNGTKSATPQVAPLSPSTSTTVHEPGTSSSSATDSNTKPTTTPMTPTTKTVDKKVVKSTPTEPSITPVSPTAPTAGVTSNSAVASSSPISSESTPKSVRSPVSRPPAPSKATSSQVSKSNTIVEKKSSTPSQSRSQSREVSPNKSTTTTTSTSGSASDKKKSTPSSSSSSSSSKKKKQPAPPSNAAASSFSSSSATTKKSASNGGVDYDRQRRAAMRAKREASKARADNQTSEKKNQDTNTKDDDDENQDGNQDGNQDDESSPTDVMTESKTHTASSVDPASIRSSSPPPPSSSLKSPKRASSAEKTPRRVRPTPPTQQVPHRPPPWAPPAAYQAQVEKQQREREQQQQQQQQRDADDGAACAEEKDGSPDVDSSDPRAVYAFQDGRSGWSSSPIAATRPSTREGVASSSSLAPTRAHSRASNALARTRIMASIGQRRPGTTLRRKSMTTTPTSHKPLPQRQYYPLQPSPPPHPTYSTVEERLAEQRLVDSLEARSVVQAATEVLRSVISGPTPIARNNNNDATTTNGRDATHEFVAPTPPLNSTIPHAVPRCYPARHLTPRMASARFHRSNGGGGGSSVGSMRRSHNKNLWFDPTKLVHVDDDDENGGTSQSVEPKWDVSSELQYGHSLLSGLKERTRQLTQNLESHGLESEERFGTSIGGSGGVGNGTSGIGMTNGRTIAVERSNLFQSINVTQSLEKYYTILSQLDVQLRQQKEEKSLLHQVLFQPTIRIDPTTMMSNTNGQGAAGVGGANTIRPKTARTSSSSMMSSSSPPPWIHSNTARPSFPLRPSSSHPSRRPIGDHPNGPIDFVPRYESLEDPNVGILSPQRTRTIRQTRSYDFKLQPELGVLLTAREDAFRYDQQAQAAEELAEKRRKLRMDTPEAKISQRPASANVGVRTTQNGAVGGSSKAPPAHPNQRKPMTARISQVSSVYSNGGSQSARPNNGRHAKKADGRIASSSSSSNYPVTRHDYMNDLEPIDRDGDVDGVDDDGTPTNVDPEDASISSELDWQKITSSWPEEPSPLTLRISQLGLNDNQHQNSTKDHMNPISNLSKDSPTRLCSEFELAERCLVELHQQMGLTLEGDKKGRRKEKKEEHGDEDGENEDDDGDDDNGGDTLRWSITRPPTPAQVDALKKAIEAILQCKDQLARIVQAIQQRQNLLLRLEQQLSSSSSSSSDSTSTAHVIDVDLSRLTSHDLHLLDLLRHFIDSIRSNFSEHSEFGSGRFIWSGEDLSKRIIRDKAKVMRRINQRRRGGEGGEQDVLGDNNNNSTHPPRSLDPSLEQLANSKRSPSEIATAAAAIVLEKITQQAQSIQQAQGY